MGIKVWPGRVISKADQMNRECESLKEAVEREVFAMEVLHSSESSLEQLKGQAWSSARTYVAEIQKPLLGLTLDWLAYQLEGNSRYRSAAQHLPMVACLDEDQLEDDLNYWENRLSREYEREYPRSSVIRNCRKMIQEMKTKLIALRGFVRETNGIYDQAAALQAVLDRADTEVGKVNYHPQTAQIDFSSVDKVWLSDVRWTGVLEELKADGATEDELRRVRGLEELGLSPKEALAQWEAVKERGISRAELDRVGQDIPGIIVVWNGTTTEEDRRLITGLIKRDYKGAFQTDAKKITEVAQLFLSEYTLQLTLGDGNGDRELEEFLNEILSSSLNETAWMEPDSENSRNRMEYIKLLYSGMSILMELEGGAIRRPKDLPDGMLEHLIYRNERLMKLTTLCAGMYDVLQNKRDQGEGIKNAAKLTLKNLKFREGMDSYSFQICYDGVRKILPPYDDRIYETMNGSVEVVSKILERPSSVSGEIYLEACRDLEKSKEALKEKLMFDITYNGLAALIGVASPAVGAALGGLYNLAQGDTGGGMGAGKDILSELATKDTNWKNFLDGGFSAVSMEWVKSGVDFKDGVEEESKKSVYENWRERMSWFGQGGVYEVDGEKKLVVAGVYNPETLRRIGVWETEGLEGLMQDVYGRSLLVVNGRTLDKTEIEKFEASLTKVELIIWKGGEIYSLDPETFQIAVGGLEEKYRRMNDNGISIKGLMYAEGSQGE